MKHLLSSILFVLALVTAPTVLSASQDASQSSEQVETRSVDINTASVQILSEQLRGIGPAKAKAIVDYRQKHGKFASPDDLVEVKGIGASTLEKNRDRIKVSS